MAEVAEGDSRKTVSQVPPDMNNFGKVTGRYIVGFRTTRDFEK
jgi:hypothetical protein